MTEQQFPKLEPGSLAETRDALHAYARVLGSWTSKRNKRKHWWHASLRPSLNGLSTGVIHGGLDFEIELNLRDSLLLARSSSGDQLQEELRGQPASQVGAKVREFLITAGVDAGVVPDDNKAGSDGFDAYSPEQARLMGRAVNSVAAIMETFRASIREETSPIQLWPHHFDLAMLWLPGGKVPGQDPDDEEYADQQMNFGFTFGDEGIPEPYFYVTAYPLPEALPDVRLPKGTNWRTEGFSGAVLLYQSLAQNADPDAYLSGLWSSLLSAGREHLKAGVSKG